MPLVARLALNVHHTGVPRGGVARRPLPTLWLALFDPLQLCHDLLDDFVPLGLGVAVLLDEVHTALFEAAAQVEPELLDTLYSLLPPGFLFLVLDCLYILNLPSRETAKRVMISGV